MGITDVRLTHNRIRTQLCVSCLSVGKMSILRFFTPKKSNKNEELEDRNEDPLDAILPTCSASSDIQCTNSEIKDIIKTGVKRKRGAYSHYDDCTRAEIGKHAMLHGNASAARHFTKKLKLEKPMNESTVRSIKASYKRQLDKTPEKSLETLSKSPSHGRPKLLGKYDDDVIDYVRKLRQSGSIVNRQIVIASARGIIMSKNKYILEEFGGHIVLGRSWAESFMNRIGFVRRKRTKAARKLPFDFEDQKQEFLSRVRDMREKYLIPDELVINFDQTNISIIPCGNWTMDEKGSKQISTTGLEDKRQITALLSCTMMGALLPPQLLYQGKTDQCHPSTKFPNDWDIYHTENHWSNEESMIRFIDKIITPYVNNMRESLDLPLKHPALLIFDCFAAHRVDSFLQKLEKCNYKCAFIPGGCTGELQPLDLSGNAQIKDEVKRQFTLWYADMVQKQLNGGTSVETLNIDLKLSTVKPIHARWVIAAFENIKNDSEIIKSGWYRSGLLKKQ